jgi:hypothetical protein
LEGIVMTAPVLQAMLLADQVYQDRATGKYVICGIFSAIHFTPRDDSASKNREGGNGSGLGLGAGGNGAESAGSSGGETPAPAPVPIARLVRAGSPFAYISLTELQGSRKFELRYVDLSEINTLFATSFEVSCRDPLETIQITVPLPPLPIPHEGVFVLELLCEGELLGSHRVLAKSQTKP